MKRREEDKRIYMKRDDIHEEKRKLIIGEEDIHEKKRIYMKRRGY